MAFAPSTLEGYLGLAAIAFAAVVVYIRQCSQCSTLLWLLKVNHFPTHLEFMLSSRLINTGPENLGLGKLQ